MPMIVSSSGLRVGRRGRGSLTCAAVVVRRLLCDEAIRTACHVGEGVYLTARHVGSQAIRRFVVSVAQTLL